MTHGARGLKSKISQTVYMTMDLKYLSTLIISVIYYYFVSYKTSTYTTYMSY